ncbi:DUF2189 domain-containing protein [Frigidibacter sp. ROC022]|uniref:DUF2189 domain-containing protein n=1 Tax=Frigidibacter sp. ROC022 TaxID=2971796 RepID=UPI00215A462D|nr:DUF2189 domain-containing protein [Frigidibacter sp. ROC022]MCR8723553.1 DUF2189 domain-containing protein [Frigidibacter sp. ROC022]
MPEPVEASVLPEVGRVTISDLISALKAGVWDFRRAPLFGLFFSAVYVLAGFALIWLGAGTMAWVLTLSLGFPLVAPFAAVGLYEVSRRLEAGEALDWRGVLGVVAAERGRQVPWIGAILTIAFLFWSFLAHLLFALVMGVTALRTGMLDWGMFLTWPGLALVGAELAVGGLTAFLIFGLTVVSLPLCLDCEVDFVSAMLLSLAVVRRNRAVMALWAVLIGLGLLIGMLPAFLGLMVVLPVLGHASWHLYRRALYVPV